MSSLHFLFHFALLSPYLKKIHSNKGSKSRVHLLEWRHKHRFYAQAGGFVQTIANHIPKLEDTLLNEFDKTNETTEPLYESCDIYTGRMLTLCSERFFVQTMANLHY